MRKYLIAFAILFDLACSIIAVLWSAYCMYLGNQLDAIYFILAAIFLGRGAVVRQTAKAIREELEAMERGEA